MSTGFCLTFVSNVQSLPVVAHAAISRTDMGVTPARAFRHVDARPRGDTASQVIEKPPIPICLPAAAGWLRGRVSSSSRQDQGLRDRGDVVVVSFGRLEAKAHGRDREVGAACSPPRFALGDKAFGALAE